MRRVWRLIGTLALCSLPSILLAQEITVRSGAHDGFARLVLRIPQGGDWELSQTDVGVRFELAEHRSGFDTSGVFELIDQRFIQSVTGNSGSLDIEFACDCAANTFLERGEFVVIDVSDRSDDQEVLPTDALSGLSWPIGTRRFVFGNIPTLDAASIEEVELGSDQPTNENLETVRQNVPSILSVDQAQPRRGNEWATSERNQTLESTPRQQFTADLNTLLPSSDEAKNRVTDRLAAAQQKLAKRIAIAATKGILEPTQRSVDLPLISSRPQIDIEIFDSSIPTNIDDKAQDQTGSLNLRITSSSDIPSRSTATEFDSTSMGVRCIPPEQVAVETWGTEATPAKKISEYRANLFTESDRLDKETAIKLAKLYLYLGFGAEARQILSIDPSLISDNPWLMEIADIMEHGHARSGTYLKHFADCESAAALWGILAQNSLAPSEPIDADAALRTVTALPLHLRRFIAPKLSRRLLNYGDEARAETALRSVDRTPEPATANANLARAELQLANGETETAQHTLSGIVSSNEQQSAEALIKFVDSHLEADTLIDSSVATLIEAYAIEMRGDPIGAELKRSHVLALAKSGQFDEAFEALARMRDIDGEAKKIELESLLLDIVTRAAPDVVFLESAFELIRRPLSVTNPDLSFSIAERAAGLGFPQLAEVILKASENTPVSSRSKELRARVALALGRPSEAHAELFGVQTETADRLRARAKSVEQKYDDAVSLYDQLGEQDQSLRAAWLAEDWLRLSDAEDNPFAPVASIIKSTMETSDDVDGMLGRMTDAISESQQARSVIESLLNGTTDDDVISSP